MKPTSGGGSAAAPSAEPTSAITPLAVPPVSTIADVARAAERRPREKTSLRRGRSTKSLAPPVTEMSADGRAFQCLTISRVTRMSTTSSGTTAYFATRALRSPTKRSEPYASQNCPGRTCM